MLTILAITHVPFEDLGSLDIALTRAGFKSEVIDACTANLHVVDALDPDLMVVLGGPVGVYEREAYPFIELEIELLRARLAARRPTLGICLGAQLMATALGARVYPGTSGKELGWASVHSGSDLIVPTWFQTLLTPQLHVLHWHGDTFDLPAGATHLARTARYANQAFSFGSYALALQFHPEVTVQGLERWYVGHAHELAQAGFPVRRLREETRIFGPKLEAAAGKFWQQWLDHVLN
jgi:GMP synthase (glutamine-hydrolysing)